MFTLQASQDAEGAAEQLEEAQRLTRQVEQQVQELEAAQQEQAKNAAVSAEDADGTGCLHLSVLQMYSHVSMNASTIPTSNMVDRFIFAKP